nr:uncharacterized protein LOC116771122 [Danaus plexippus plexippus]
MLNILLTFSLMVVSVVGHGRVLQPPSRASMWRSGFPTPHNYDDDGLNCGGFYRQYTINKGKCGICGDAYDMKPPKSHELGGKYGQGIIVSNFEPEQIFTVTVEITAYHRGYWYFKICPNPKTNRQSCFDKYPVELATGGTNFYPSKGGVYKVKYRLPKGLVCDHCVLQWRYVAGNNWGFCGNGTSGLGCGNQETFGACSDISISENSIDTDARPVKFATASNDISEDLNRILNLLRKVTAKPKYKKTKPKPNQKKNRNHRKPRHDTRPSKRKKDWQFI